MIAKETCDKNPSDVRSFPPTLALQIVRKAAALAGEFEDAALTKLTTDAQSVERWDASERDRKSPWADLVNPSRTQLQFTCLRYSSIIMLTGSKLGAISW
jgi:hypothetical protein